MSKLKFVATLFISFAMFCTGAFAAPSVRQLGNIAQKQIESKAAEKSSANAIPLPIKARVATPMITKATSSSTFSKTKTVSTDSKRLPNIKPSSYTGNTSTNTNTNTTPTTVTQKSQTITYLSELNTSIQNLNNSVENKTSQLESQIATTKTDLEGQIENAVSDKATTTELAGAKSELQGSIASTKTALEGTIAGTKTDLEGTIASTKSDLETEINKKANQLLVDSIVSVFDKDSDNNLTNVKVDYIPASIPTSKIANLDTKIADLDEIKGTLNDSENGFAKVKEKAFGALQKNSLEGELNTYVTTNKLVNETFVTDQIDAIDLSDYATNDAVDTKFSLLDFKVEDEKVKFTTDNEQWTDVAPVSAFGGTPGCAPTIDSEEVTDEEGKKSLKLTITPCEGVAYDKFIPYGEKGADACDIRILKSKVAGITTLTAKDCEDNVKWTETIEDGETPTQCTLTKTTQEIKDSNNKKIGTKLTITDSCDPDNPTVIDVDDGEDGETPTQCTLTKTTQEIKDSNNKKIGTKLTITDSCDPSNPTIIDVDDGEDGETPTQCTLTKTTQDIKDSNNKKIGTKLTITDSCDPDNPTVIDVDDGEDGETPTQCTLTKTTQDIKDSNNKKIGTKLTITDSCDPDNPTVIDVDDGQDGETPTQCTLTKTTQDIKDSNNKKIGTKLTITDSCDPDNPTVIDVDDGQDGETPTQCTLTKTTEDIKDSNNKKTGTRLTITDSCDPSNPTIIDVDDGQDGETPTQCTFTKTTEDIKDSNNKKIGTKLTITDSCDPSNPTVIDVDDGEDGETPTQCTLTKTTQDIKDSNNKKIGTKLTITDSCDPDNPTVINVDDGQDGETPAQCTLTKTTEDIKDSNNKKTGTKLTITDSCDPDNPTVIDVDDGQDGEIPTDYATPDDIEDLYDAIDELEIPDVPGNIDKIAEKFDNNGELIVEQLPESMKSALAAGSEARSFFDNEGKIDASNLRGTINNNNLSSCQSVTYDYNVGKPTTANVTLPAGFDTPDAGYNAASTALGYVVETTTNPCVSGFVPAMRKLNDSCDATYPFSTKTASYNIHRCSHQNGELNNGMISATLYYWIEQVTSSNSLAVQMNQAAATAASAVETANSANSAAQLASSTAGTVAGYFKKGEDDQVYLDTNHLSNVPSSAIAFNQTQNSVFNNFATVQNTANSLAQAVNGVDCNGVDGPCTASAGLLSKFNAIVQAFQDAGMLTMNCTGGSCTATATAKPNNNEPSM